MGLTLAFGACSAPDGGEQLGQVSAAIQPEVVDVQILALNDFHGNLEPPSGSSGRIGTVNAGGAEYLATHLSNLAALNPNTLRVSAGDLVGASPLLSALFHDEPSIEAFNLMGFDYHGVGNHEFDEGSVELRRLKSGGCHAVDGCQDGDDFLGAEFQFLAANVITDKNDQTLFPPYKIHSFGGAKIAFIGMTLEATPLLVTPTGVAGLSFQDEADTVNALVRELQDVQGVQTFVILLHEGGFQTGTYNDCVGLTGPIVDIADRLDDAVDVVVSAHTHQPYNCRIDNKLVTSASSFGRVITKIDLTIDRTTGDVLAKNAENRIVTRDVAKDPAMTALLDKYRAIAAPLANRVVGSIAADMTNVNNAAGESQIGDVIADAQLEATAPAALGGAVAAFMNPGGIRASLTYTGSPAGEGDGNVTYGEAFTVQPFGNTLMTMDLTGDQIHTMLEQQWLNQPAPKVLQISASVSYSWSASLPAGSRVDPASIRINGVVVDPASTYRVTVNNFLADGGDGFTILRNGTNRLGGAVDLDAMVDYLGLHSPVQPGLQDRITRLP